MRRIVDGHMNCSKCKHPKPLSGFRYRSNGRLHSWCIDCKRELDRKTGRVKRRKAA